MKSRPRDGLAAKGLLVQSLNSPFFPPHIGAEPGRARVPLLNLDPRSSPAKRFQNGGSFPSPLHFELVLVFLPTILRVGGSYT